MVYNSRLARIEEKRNMRKAFLLIGLVVVVVVGLVAAGPPLLVKLVGIIAPKSSGTPVKDDLIAPIPPQIELPYSATNSGTINVSGLAEPGSTVFLSINGKTQQTTTNNDGTFTVTNVNLSDGNNSLTAVAMDQAGNRSQTSDTQNVQLITKAVTIKIDTPSDGAQINDRRTLVSGSVSGPVDHITINGRLVSVSSDNKFSYQLPLQSGANTIAVIAQDLAGNTSHSEVNVTSTQ